jgi:alkaline phosphatase D
VTDESRQLLGDEQERWLTAGLTTSTARWKLLGNQVVLSPIKVVPAPSATGAAVFANPDQWDGYPAAQDRLFDVLEGVDDVVVLTGDVHASFAFEVTRDANDPLTYDPVTGRGALAVELVAPSVSSAGDAPDPLASPPEDPEGVVEVLAARNGDALRLANPHLKYVRTQLNGHLLVDVTPEQVRAEWWLVPTVTAPSDEQTLDKTFVVRAGSSRLVEPTVLPLGA